MIAVACKLLQIVSIPSNTIVIHTPGVAFVTGNEFSVISNVNANQVSVTLYGIVLVPGSVRIGAVISH
jgi:hypothetical protein